MSVYVDARGKQCPIPIVMAKKAISEMGCGVVTVAVDNEIAVQNLTKMANQKGYGVEARQIDVNHYEVTMTVADVSKEGETDSAAGNNTADQNKAASCPTCLPENQTTVVVISSDRMGEGDEALGKILIKGFLYALSQLDELPSAVIFYNSGAYLTCEGSDSLEDLHAMEEQGVTIYTCGTCLNHYGLTEKLAVGSVTNMYVIVETMAQAGKIIKP
ncbi:MAG: sulfurtransferase-like selenium metabolism protein YedF [Lachnospiraceae bacterium]|nr:sulfurtransferase-like selenium metabolism protein YedF [Lachnospiraceae bacterium]